MLIDSWKVVEQFEERLAAYCGAPYAVAVDTCTAALFLCLKLTGSGWPVRLPCQTYLGVACAIKHAGIGLRLADYHWYGSYRLDPYPIVDSACRLTQGMYRPDTLTCLSFQSRKHLKIGRGGAVLTDDPGHTAWLRQARFCGRPAPGAPPAFVGWHAYLEPERAARGLVLLDALPAENADLAFTYPDLRDYEVLR